ncbi:guanylate cyclase 32E-like [Uloborus diversus]|uniref:guanylate cyclase 32E-like n=1 Tax=Uloborus diversus TaxID=327109 RepID=UPI002409C6BD|nr:guanylate cyclase 32E-like [Uloborus diversus]
MRPDLVWTCLGESSESFVGEVCLRAGEVTGGGGDEWTSADPFADAIRADEQGGQDKLIHFCARPETSDKKLFPTFARTRPPDIQISRSVASLLHVFRWLKVAFLYSSNPESPFKDVSRTIVTTLDQAGIHIKYVGTWSFTYHYGYAENPFDNMVEESYLDTRIYVILGFHFEHLGLMMSLHKKGLLENGEYFVVGVDIEQYESEHPTKYLKGLLKDDIEVEAKEAFRSYLGVVASNPKGFNDFEVKVNKYMQFPPFNFPNPAKTVGGMKKVPAEGAYLYDAVYVYARALNDCLAKNEDPFNGRNLMKYIFEKTYFSAMGYMVYMDKHGDAEGNYSLIARKPIPGAAGEFGLIPVGVFQLPENRSGIQVLKLISDIEWINGIPPVDEPMCGFHGQKCVVWKIAISIFGMMIVIVLIVLFVSYRNWAYEQELDSLLWKIDFKDIEINECAASVIAGHISKNIYTLIRTSQGSLSSNLEGDFRLSSIYTTVGVYKARMVAVKQLRKKNIDVNMSMKKNFKVMRDMRHDNLNPFIGACIEPPNICIVTEYCSRGSLKDILSNEDVKLDNMFNASLIGDIVRGMIFLHESPLRTHGNLKSSNCLVDSRWVVKITDFGLQELKFGADVEDCDTDLEKVCEKLLWKSPELLRDPHSPIGGSQKGDVYSFGIILFEIIGRSGPYGNTRMPASEIIIRVIEETEGEPFRPPLSKLQASFDCVINCMQECWHEVPEHRPDFKTIRAKLRPMRRGLKPHIFDNMLEMMEKYANNLEALVDERTDQLIEEKKKTDALLYEMLPTYVADELKKGHRVEAESFDCVTIYFSDIVGFTTISAQCSPLEVVNLLNDLYTCFDSIIENYDVYKVETIGDAYMVASGLPVRNGDNHAAEIASMALNLLDAIKRFPIRHKRNDALMLRIGIHSGPVCAGIVGQKMPRYCLFGDTVNTASRMESSGQPLRIHCSQSFKDLAEHVGGYELKERGVINIKGKGEMRTYWLIGQESYREKEKKIDKTTKNTKPIRRSSLKQDRNFSMQFSMQHIVPRCLKRLRFTSASVPDASIDVVSSTNIYGTTQIQSCDVLGTYLPFSKCTTRNSTPGSCLISKSSSLPCMSMSCELCRGGNISLTDKLSTAVISRENSYPHLFFKNHRWEKLIQLPSIEIAEYSDENDQTALTLSRAQSVPLLLYSGQKYEFS